MRNYMKAVLCVSSMMSLAACSSIIEGRSQEIVINTNPAGATCTLMRNDMPIGTVSPTPSAILIEKTKYDIVIKCDKDGYQQATYFNKSGAAGATFGNIVLGGGIGWAIDSATGSDNKYDSPVNLTLAQNVADVGDEEKPKHHHKTTAANTVTGDTKLNVAQSTTGPVVADRTQTDYPMSKK